MKRALCFVLSALVLITATIFNAKSAVSLSASGAVLYCPHNGRVYYSLNENKKQKIASTTKLMTALLTLEYAEKNNKKVKFTRDMTAEGSSMYLNEGEVLTLRDLAVGIMLCSGNDAANAAAVAVAGSREKFVRMMNKRARKIGMSNTSFANPCGLDDSNHYSTPYDMALLMSAALKNKAFARLTACKTATVNFIYPPDKTVTYTNHNRLLSLYRYCVGGKTGYTMASGRCLVTVARKDGLTLIAVTLNDRNDWNDHIALYDYGFEALGMRRLDDRELYLDVDTVGGESGKTTVGSEDVTDIVLPREDYNRVKREIVLDNFIYAPVKAGGKLGRVRYTLRGKTIAVHSLIALTDNNSYRENKSVWDYIKGFFNNGF